MYVSRHFDALSTFVNFNFEFIFEGDCAHLTRFELNFVDLFYIKSDELDFLIEKKNQTVLRSKLATVITSTRTNSLEKKNRWYLLQTNFKWYN